MLSRVSSAVPVYKSISIAQRTPVRFASSRKPDVGLAMSIEGTLKFAKNENAPKSAIKIHGVTGGYAHALFDVGANHNALETFEKEAKAFFNFIVKNKKAREERSPDALFDFEDLGIGKDVKEKFVDTFAKFEKLSPLFTNFLKVVVQNRRTELTTAILQDYFKLMKAHRKEVEVIITTASPLGPGEAQSFAEQLKMEKFTPEEKLVIIEKVDEELIGGYKYQIGDEVVDESWLTRGKKFEQAFLRRVEENLSKLSFRIRGL